MSTAGLHIEARGSGPAVVFTTGFGRTSGTWAPQAAALAEDHHVVTWDFRGHGRSAPPGTKYTRNMALDDLDAVVEVAMGAAGGPALLVGHSLGGYLSLAYTLGHGEKVRGLALLSTGPGFRNPDSMARYNAGITKVADAAGLGEDTAHVAYHFDSMVIDRLAEITVPAVVMCGLDDRPVYVNGVRYLADRLPQATLVEIPGAAHEPHVDRPDDVTAALRAHEALLAGR